MNRRDFDNAKTAVRKFSFPYLQFMMQKVSEILDIISRVWNARTAAAADGIDAAIAASDAVAASDTTTAPVAAAAAGTAVVARQ